MTQTTRRRDWMVTYTSEVWGMRILAVLGAIAVGRLYVPLIIQWVK